MAIDLITSVKVYHGNAFDVRRDAVRFHDKNIAHLDIVEHIGAVTIVPVDAEGRILFVRQYRHAVGKELLELPAGTLDEGEEPEACALREIREETGFAAGKLTWLGEFFLAPGYSTEFMTAYLATGLTPAPLPGDEDEFITLEPIAVQEAYAMAARGDVDDGKTLAVLLLARPYLE